MLRFFIYYFILVNYTPWQHEVQAVQQTIATMSTHYEPLNKNKQLLHTIASTILVLFSFSWNKHSLQPTAKKVQGHQQRAPQKQHSFCGLFNFFGRTQPAYSSKIITRLSTKDTLLDRSKIWLFNKNNYKERQNKVFVLFFQISWKRNAPCRQ